MVLPFIACQIRLAPYLVSDPTGGAVPPCMPVAHLGIDLQCNFGSEIFVEQVRICRQTAGDEAAVPYSGDSFIMRAIKSDGSRAWRMLAPMRHSVKRKPLPHLVRTTPGHVTDFDVDTQPRCQLL